MSRERTRGRAASVLAWALVITLAGCQVSSDVSLSEEDRLLEDIMDAYVSERFRFYPIEATFSGLPGNDYRLGSYSRTAMDERVQWLEDFHYKLLGLRPTALSPAGYLDALWLTSLVKAELFEIEERAVWRRSASFYGELVLLGLVSLLAEGDLASRADALAGRLGDIPQLFSEAQANLEPAHAVWRADGRESLDRCRRLLEDLPEMLADRLPPYQVAELAGLSREALRSVQDLVGAIPRVQSGDAPVGFALGERALEKFFLYDRMVDSPLDEIAMTAENELAEFTHRLTELTLNELTAKTMASALARKPPTDSVDAEVIAAEARVLAFVRERQGASALEASIPVRRVAAYFPSPETVRLWRPKALEPTRGSFLMVRDIAEPDVDELELLTLREVGGRARQYARQAESASLLRRVFASSTTSEGWLARYASGALRDGFHAENDDLRVEHYQRSILAMARLLAVIGLHARGQSLEDTATMFRERGLLSPGAAQTEAARVAVDPGLGDAGLGTLLVQELADDYQRRYPLSEPSDLETRLLADGLLPVRLLRFDLLD